MSHIQVVNHALQICDGSTGHSVKSIAYCDSSERAREIGEKLNSHDKLVKALEVMTSLTRVKYGNMDAHVYAEILKAIEALAAAKGE